MTYTNNNYYYCCVKQYRFTLSEVKKLVEEGFQYVTAERWRSLIKHVEEKVEDHYWQHDGLYEQQVDELIITVGGEDDGSSDDDSDTNGP